MTGSALGGAADRDRVIQALAGEPDRFRVIRDPSVPGGLGPDEVDELSRLAGPDRSQGPRLPVPDGWTELRVRDVHQTLLLTDADRSRGVLAQIAVTLAGMPGARPGEAPAADVLPVPQDLALAVERWSGGGWNGVHAAWLHHGPDGVIQHRRWDLPAAGGVEVTVMSRYAAALGKYLDHRVDAMVAGLEASDAGPWPGSVDQAAERFSQWQAGRQLPVPMPDPITLGPAGVDWIDRLPQLAEASRGRLEVAPPAAPADAVTAGLAQADGTPTESGRRISRTRREARTRLDIHRTDATGTSARGRMWIDEDRALAVAAPSVPEGHHQVGLYPRPRTAELILRMIGFVPEGPHVPPEDPLTWEQLFASPSASEGLEGPANPLQAWWASPRVLWQVVPHLREGGSAHRSDTAGQAVGPVLQILTVPGFGHYRCLPSGPGSPARFRLEAVSGLALLQHVRDWCRSLS